MGRLSPKMIEAVECARDLLSSQRNWVQGAFRDAPSEGNVRYCAIGAVRECYGSVDIPQTLDNELDAVSRQLFSMNVIAVNDDNMVQPRTAYRRVLRIFDTILEQQQSKGAEQAT